MAGAACSRARVWCIARRCSSRQKFARSRAATRNARCLLTLATRIEEAWLRELFPEAFRETVEVAFDAAARRVTARRQTTFHDLDLAQRTGDAPPDEAGGALLAKEVIAGTCPLKNWDNAVEQWILRVNCVATVVPGARDPVHRRRGQAAASLSRSARGAFSYKEIKERPVWPAVKSWLSARSSSVIEQFAPERIELPNGRKVKITYSASAAPAVAARIQDLYGVERNLTIGRGRVPLVIQVLAPNHRPIQITSDLEGFWRDAYPKIKKELQRKYPKHEWR